MQKRNVSYKPTTHGNDTYNDVWRTDGEHKGHICVYKLDAVFFTHETYFPHPVPRPNEIKLFRAVSTSGSPQSLRNRWRCDAESAPVGRVAPLLLHLFAGDAALIDKEETMMGL